MTVILISCGEGNGNYEDEFREYYDEVSGFENGTYCAEVDYYNPNTGTTATYTLNVEVENNELTVIYWANGGGLDDDHFYPEELDSDGRCSIESDKGYEYEIQITGSPCSFTDEEDAELQYETDMTALTCSMCGNEMDEFDDYCYNCTDKIEHTCPRCGQYDSFMYSTDDYCTDCADEIENTCSRCGGREYNVNGGLCSDCENGND